MSAYATCLSQLFNLSMSIGQFSDIWKVARVAPIYKGGLTDDRSNYRPISVLLYLDQVLARSFKGNASIHSEETNQHGEHDL